MGRFSSSASRSGCSSAGPGVAEVHALMRVSGKDGALLGLVEKLAASVERYEKHLPEWTANAESETMARVAVPVGQ